MLDTTPWRFQGKQEQALLLLECYASLEVQYNSTCMINLVHNSAKEHLSVYVRSTSTVMILFWKDINSRARICCDDIPTTMSFHHDYFQFIGIPSF